MNRLMSGTVVCCSRTTESVGQATTHNRDTVRRDVAGRVSVRNHEHVLKYLLQLLRHRRARV